MPLGPGSKVVALGVAMALVAGGVLLMLPGEALPVTDFPGSDKLAHVGLFILVGVETLLLYAWRRSAPLYARHYAAAILISAALGAVSEAAQSGIPGRSADVTDLAADVLGGAMGGLTFRIVGSAQARRAPK